MQNIQKLQTSIEPLRQQIINHKVYSVINDLEDLKIFMQYHIYAVWDFMSLLKALQNNLTCTSVPWFPIGSANTRHLINEIVVGEECDVDLDGVRKSHFEIYLDAMEQCGANTDFIITFVNTLQETKNFSSAFFDSATPKEAQDFVEFTFKVIDSKKAHLQAAIFTFGREDLIPDMFYSIVHDLNKKFPEIITKFNYYLERHIEVDGDHHSHLALKMTSNLCDQNPDFWNEAEQIAIESLQMRISLWDGIYNEIMSRRI